MTQQHDTYKSSATPVLTRLYALTSRGWILGALCVLPALGSLAAGPVADAAGSGANRPAWQLQTTPLKPRPASGLAPLKLRYEVSWSHWVRAGSIDIEFRPGKDRSTRWVQANARAKSLGVVRTLYTYDSDTSAQTSYEDLIPRRFTHVQTENGVSAEYDAQYLNGRMRIDWTVIPKDGKGAERKTLYHDVDGIRDVLSTLLYLQRTEFADNHDIVLLVQPAERLYRVTFRVLGRESHKVMDKTWSTIKLDMQVRSVTDELDLSPYTKMRRTTLWISDDTYRVPVDIQAELFIGFVSVRLLSRTPL